MYFSNLDIPYEVVVFLLKQEAWDKINDGTVSAFKTIVLGKQKATKPKIEKTIQEILNINRRNNSSYKIEEKDIYTKTLRNIDFGLYMLPEQTREYYDREYCIYVGLKIPALKLNYELNTLVRQNNFIDIVSKCRYITNGRVHGSFLFMQGNLSYYQFRPEDDNLIENIRRVNILSECKKTTSLEPGHIYILKDKVKILYLGTLKEIRTMNSSYWRNETQHSFFSKYYEGIKFESSSGGLYINLDTIDYRSYITETSMLDFIESQRGTPISEFINKWFEFYETTGDDISNCFYYYDKLVGESGIDQGEFLIDDSPDLCKILSDISLSRINLVAMDKKNENLITSYSIGLGVDGLKTISDGVKDKISNIIIKPALDKLFKGCVYRVGSDSYSKILAENSSGMNIYTLLKNLGLYYIDVIDQLCNPNRSSNSLGGLLYLGRDKERDSLIIGSKKTFFKK